MEHIYVVQASSSGNWLVMMSRMIYFILVHSEIVNYTQYKIHKQGS